MRYVRVSLSPSVIEHASRSGMGVLKCFCREEGFPLENGKAVKETVDEQAALLGPHRMHGRAGLPAAVLPAMRMGPCISFLLVACGE